MPTQKIQILNGASVIPNPDWTQTDETKADYIKNKPTKLSQFENDSMFTTSDDISSITPSIGDNGNWFVGSVDTGVVAKGVDGKGIKNISINDIVKDGFVTGKKCLTVIYSDDTKTEIQLPEIFNKDILIHEIDNGVCINYVDTNDVSEYNITNGRGIVSIDKTSTSGLVDTYTITYTDNTTSTFNVTNSVPKSEIEKLSGEVDTLHQSLVDYAKKSEIPAVPTKVSELENDSGYLTEHQSLVEYAKKTEVPTIPESLKNPNALTIKIGDTTTTYDGSEAKTVEVSADEFIPLYWLTHLQTKADKIREVMEAAGRNKSAFLFYTDVHWDAGEKKAPMLLKYLYNNTPINKTIFGGDIVNSESTDRNVMKYLWEWRKQVRELPNHHSVVGNHDDGNATNNLFSTDYIYSFLLAAEENPNIVQGGDMYYYIDEPCEKTRYLYLDTAYIGINSSQTTFIKEALKTAPNNWHIVAISHIWYKPDYNQYNVRPIPIDGYGTGVEDIVNLFDNYNARQGEFSSCTAKVEFCIGGHCHRDYVGRTAGGIPIILCETDSHHNRSGLTDTAGTTTESSVSAIIVNYSTEKINVIRIGRGENFEVPLRSSVAPPASYTNLISTAIDTSGNVYNSSGYKAGTYINNADGLTEVDNPAHWCTGLIPITKGDVVRIKYVFDKTTYNDDNLHYFSTLCFYNDDKSFNRFKYLNDFLNNNFISGGYEWSGTNFEGTLTFTFDGTSSMFNKAKYIRVSDTYLGSSENVQTSIKNAVITINEEI